MSTTETVKTAMREAIAVANSATGNTDSNVTDAIHSLVAALNSAREEGGGISLPTLTNPATDEDVTSGKEYVGGNGAKRTGTSTAKEDLVSTTEQLQLANQSIASAISAAENATGGDYSTLSGAVSALVAGYGQGGGAALINGKFFDCGVLEFTSDQTINIDIAHSLNAVPSAAFFWAADAPFDRRGILGKYRAHAESEQYTVAGLSANGGLASSVGTSSNRSRIGWDAQKITVNADATYPLLGGIVYQWLVIA